MLNGEVYSGAFQGAGEFGHVVVEERTKDTLNFYDDFIYRNGLWDDFAPDLNKFLAEDKKALKRANKTVER